jgi:hypothetical protein
MEAELRFDVDLPEGWHALADAGLREEARAVVAAGLDAVLADVGIPARAVPALHRVNVDARDYPAWPTMALSVEGSLAECPPETAARVLASTLGEPLQRVHLEPPAWLTDPEPRGAARSQVTRYLGALASELARRRPAALLTAPLGRRVAEEVAALGAPVSPSDVSAIEGLLRLLVAQRVGIAERAAIAERWRDGRAARESIASIAESLVDAAGPAVRILASRPTLRALGSGSSRERAVAARLRDGAYYDLGLRWPDWRLEVDESLPDGGFAFAVGAQRTTPYFGLGHGEWLEPAEAGYEGPAWLHPRTLAPLVRRRGAADAAPESAMGPLAYALAWLDETLRSLGPCFVTREGIASEIERRAYSSPGLARVFQTRLSVEDLVQGLRLLAAEQVSIRNLRGIIERSCDLDYVMADSSATIVFDDRLPLREAPDGTRLTTPLALAAFVRCGLRRQISAAAPRGGGDIEVLLLDPGVERALAAAWPSDAAPLSDIDRRALLRGLHQHLTWSPESRAPVILTTVEARWALRGVLADLWPQAVILSYQDLTPESSIRPVGRIVPEY